MSGYVVISREDYAALIQQIRIAIESVDCRKTMSDEDAELLKAAWIENDLPYHTMRLENAPPAHKPEGWDEDVH
jgi:hypothetical protein